MEMFLNAALIDPLAKISDIVRDNYRTAAVFRGHGISYCCGGNLSLQTTCEQRALDLALVLEELDKAVRTVPVSPMLHFDNWSVNFLADYILHVHHEYLRIAIPSIMEELDIFVAGHAKKMPWLLTIQETVLGLQKMLLPHLQEEEDVLFPYARQVAHAYQEMDTLAALMVRTMRKPIRETMNAEHRELTEILGTLRKLTGNYATEPNYCLRHKVIYSLLKELDHDLAQHLHLESDILYPRVLEMERELLSRALPN